LYGIVVELWKFIGMFMSLDISTITNQSRMSVLRSGAALQLNEGLSQVLTPLGAKE
jgi:hypothetical protein